MKRAELYSLLADASSILELLIVGYLFYILNSQVAIVLFLVVAFGSAFKFLLLREEHKNNEEFIENIKIKLKDEIEKIDKDKLN